MEGLADIEKDGKRLVHARAPGAVGAASSIKARVSQKGRMQDSRSNVELEVNSTGGEQCV